MKYKIYHVYMSKKHTHNKEKILLLKFESLMNCLGLKWGLSPWGKGHLKIGAYASVRELVCPILNVISGLKNSCKIESSHWLDNRKIPSATNVIESWKP